MGYAALRREPSARKDPGGDKGTAPAAARAEAFEFDIFVATPMSAYAADSEAYRQNRETILALFADLKARTRFARLFCPVLLADSAAKFDAHGQALVHDVLALEASEAFMLYYMPPLPTKPSSVFVEAGMALAARIPSVYIVRSRLDLPYMLRTADGIAVDQLGPGRGPGEVHGKRGPLVKIIELGSGGRPDAGEIAAWFESQVGKT